MRAPQNTPRAHAGGAPGGGPARQQRSSRQFGGTRVAARRPHEHGPQPPSSPRPSGSTHPRIHAPGGAAGEAHARGARETSRLTQNAMPAPKDVQAPAAHTMAKARPTLPSACSAMIRTPQRNTTLKCGIYVEKFGIKANADDGQSEGP